MHTPASRGKLGRFPKMRKWSAETHSVADDAVQREPVSAPKFPANREKYREIRGNGLRRQSFRSRCALLSGTSGESLQESEQGICNGGTGKMDSSSGNSSASSPPLATSASWRAKQTYRTFRPTSGHDHCATSAIPAFAVLIGDRTYSEVRKSAPHGLRGLNSVPYLAPRAPDPA
jgi:hypothetical protein